MSRRYRKTVCHIEDRTDWTVEEIEVGHKIGEEVKEVKGKKKPKKLNIPVWLNSKVVASVKELDGRRIFTKRLSGSKDFLRIPPGICFDLPVIEQAKEAGAVALSITDRESGRFFYLDMESFDTYKREFSRGQGDQWLVSLSKFMVNCTIQTEQVAKIAIEESPKQEEEKQMVLL